MPKPDELDFLILGHLPDRARGLASIERSMGEITRAAERAGVAFRLMRKRLIRAFDTPGDQHIERVIAEIIDRKPGRDPALRLLCASDLAQILDRK